MSEGAATPSSTIPGTLTSSARLLLIDDDTGFIQVLSRILKRYPDQRFATSGAEGLKLAREEPPDLILLDIEMPGLDGFDFCRTLKADPALANIAVIFISSHARIQAATEGFKAGGADFITKPVNQTTLLARVAEQLELKRTTDRRTSRMNELLQRSESRST